MNAAAEEVRVLVVDDEPNIVDVIQMALRYQGFSVDSAATGRDAISKVTEFKPHLMLLDIMLPDMEALRSPSAWAHSAHTSRSSSSPPATRRRTRSAA